MSGALEQDESLRLLALGDGFIYARALHLAAELSIADLLAEGPQPTKELARLTSTDPGTLHSMLRALAGCGVFTEVAQGCFGLTAVGERLRSDHPRSVRTTIAQSGRITARTFQHADHALRTGDGAFATAFGQPFWEFLRDHPEEGAAFDTAMQEHSRVERGAIVEAYDFPDTGRIVDVGGGDGTLLAAVLRARPGTTGVLFDLPHVVERNCIEEEGLTERCEITGGDIFGELPAGGDLYLMKSVLHGWNDSDVLTILRGCRRAMNPGSRLLLVERVIPPGDAAHTSKAFDFAMHVMAGGQERTGDEYARLLVEAGFAVGRFIPTGSVQSIVEALLPSSQT
ncbi:methyltransferase [Streptomyces tendae]|uniref:Methyltransferase n=1 Tax=Streptomyces tendae TaxID=1932 RepID=A0ABW7SCU9_STRTE|nr:MULTISPECIES: methyltransferase [Streptomyces]MBQ0969402.1 methyltransferase [Streptomyces sp. RK74B]MBQ1009064.1 methyltransferase [Streptomyces sp. RK23]BET45117.1 methyltransferase [Kitasatospora aureofaciens]